MVVGRILQRGTKMVERVKWNKAVTAKPDYVLKPQEQAAIQKPAAGIADNTTPGLKVVNGQVEIGHPDALIGMLLMMEAFATSDPAFVHGILSQIGAACISVKQRALQEIGINLLAIMVRLHLHMRFVLGAVQPGDIDVEPGKRGRALQQ